MPLRMSFDQLHRDTKVSVNKAYLVSPTNYCIFGILNHHHHQNVFCYVLCGYLTPVYIDGTREEMLGGANIVRVLKVRKARKLPSRHHLSEWLKMWPHSQRSMEVSTMHRSANDGPIKLWEAPAPILP